MKNQINTRDTSYQLMQNHPIRFYHPERFQLYMTRLDNPSPSYKASCFHKPQTLTLYSQTNLEQKLCDHLWWTFISIHLFYNHISMSMISIFISSITLSTEYAIDILIICSCKSILPTACIYSLLNRPWVEWKDSVYVTVKLARMGQKR